MPGSSSASPLPGGRVQIGIDTGGTFTDAAAVTRDEHGTMHVVATAKALTTKGDLAIGVGDALGAVIAQLQATDPAVQVELISVSTTLATNAVVEGHGDRVGAILVGFDDQMVERIGIAAAFPDSPVFRITGGHNHAGFEHAVLDLEMLSAQIETVPLDVKAFAVCSVFAVRNPDHERAVADFVSHRTGLPVTMSSQLTGALDATRRALTAVLNARLVSRISLLIEAVESACSTLSLDCPVLVVKGDGTRASAASIRLRPIETVMSGPAASTIGAAAMSGLSDCIMSDVGGTTTDVAVLSGGRPLLRDDGSRVGGWNTLVRAADIRTHGLGGDSEVHARGGEISVGPHRVIPVSLLADRFPEILAMLLRDIQASDVASAAQGRFCALPFGAARTLPPGLTDTESTLVTAVLQGPRPVREVATTARTLRVLQALVRRGVLAISALSVADAAHVLDRQHMWSRDAAVLATRLFARVQIMREADDSDAHDLAERVLDAAVTQSGLAIFESAMGGDTPTRGGLTFLADVASGRRERGGISISISPKLPIVAVGGPAPLLYPEVGRRLGVEVILTEHGAVANAVGAALGPITVEVVVRVEHSDSAFRVVSPEGASTHEALDDALECATNLAGTTAHQRCVDQGAAEPLTETKRDLVYLPGRTDESGLLSATVTSIATGHPRTSRVEAQRSKR